VEDELGEEANIERLGQNLENNLYCSLLFMKHSNLRNSLRSSLWVSLNNSLVDSLRIILNNSLWWRSRRGR
jgi:hypothetical protein